MSFKFKSELRFNRLKLDHDKIVRVLHIIIYKLCNHHRAALVRDVAKINPSLLSVRNSADGAAVTVSKWEGPAIRYTTAILATGESVLGASRSRRKPVGVVTSYLIALQPYLEADMTVKDVFATAAELSSMRQALVITAAPMDVAMTSAKAATDERSVLRRFSKTMWLMFDLFKLYLSKDFIDT